MRATSKYSDTRAEDKCIIIGHWSSSLRLREGKHRRGSENKSSILVHSTVGEVTAGSRHLPPIRVSYGEGKVKPHKYTMRWFFLEVLPIFLAFCLAAE